MRGVYVQNGRLYIPKWCVAYIDGKRRRRWPRPRIKTGVQYHILIVRRGAYEDEVRKMHPAFYWTGY